MPWLDPRLSGSVLVDREHGTDFSKFESFLPAFVEHRKGPSAMRHHNTSFARSDGSRCRGGSLRSSGGKKYAADKGVRRLSTKSQLVTLLHAQLSGATSSA